MGRRGRPQASIVSAAEPDVAVRLALVHEFKTRSQVFISTEAGAKGLNLQFCDTLINYDLPWNPQRIEQRIGRCHRYGQERDVTVINFLADNEAQRLTFEILSRKLDSVRHGARRFRCGAARPSTDAPRRWWARSATISRRSSAASRARPDGRRDRRRIAPPARGDGEQQRNKFEETWARAAGLIETRFDQRVKQGEFFAACRADLPRGLRASRR